MDYVQGRLEKPLTLTHAYQRRIPMTTDVTSQANSLIPVGLWILEDQELVDLIARERHLWQESFFKHYPNSSKMMANYLRGKSIQEEDRILFMIDYEGKFVGHLGLSDIRPKAATIDNVLKFSHARKGLARMALAAMIDWAQRKLLIERFNLFVREDNERAIKLYESLGFTKCRETEVHVQEYDTSKNCLVNTDKVITKVEMVNGRE